MQTATERAFKDLVGNTIASITTVTPVKLTGGKKNPLQGRVTKLVETGQVMVFANKKSNGYQNMVQRRLEKEGKNPEQFKLGRRVWGKRIAGTPFVENKGNKYLEVIYLQTPKKIQYMLDGRLVSKDTIEGLPKKSAQEIAGDQGGLDVGDKVIIRTYNLQNIVSVKTGGKEYR